MKPLECTKENEAEHMSEIEQTQQQARKQKLKPTKATVQTATADAVDDLDWIQLDNGWQLVICDEEAWAEMGLTPAGFSRIVDALQSATADQPDGRSALSQGEVEAIVTGQFEFTTPNCASNSNDPGSAM